MQGKQSERKALQEVSERKKFCTIPLSSLQTGRIPNSTDFYYKLLHNKTRIYSFMLIHFGAATSLLWIYTGSHGLKVIELYTTNNVLA